MEEYIKTLLEQVRCKKAHSLIEDEIRNHMEEQTKANLAAGMSLEEAEKEAVKDMGSPVETGISLDRIHRPQMAWNVVIIMAAITIISIVIHTLIGNAQLGSNKFACYSIVGFLLMLFVYRMDYSFMAKYAKVIAGAFLLYLFAMIVGNVGVMINGVSGLSIAGFQLSTFAIMMVYIPVYGAVVYQYYGSGWTGILRTLIWMVLPIVFAIKLPCFSLAAILFVSMAVILSIAVAKGWFQISKKGFFISFWGIIFAISIFIAKFASSINWIFQHQIMRIQGLFGNSEAHCYLAERLQSCLQMSKWIGSSTTNIFDYIPCDVNTNYILTYVTCTYGILIGLFICGILAVVAVKSFHIALKQKNQLGMLMGCGCGMVFISNMTINVLENLGLIPTIQSFLPFFSAGGSYILVSYILIGMILSIYRYKNIHPRQFKKADKRQSATV